MAREKQLVNVWTEMRTTSDGVSMTLYSEWRGPVPEVTVVEDEAWYTWSEIEEEGKLRSDLSLSDETRGFVAGASEKSLKEKAEELPDNPSEGELLDYMGLLGGEATDGRSNDGGDSREMPSVGQIVYDEAPPTWSDDNSLEVVEIPSTSADEYTIEGLGGLFGTTVADENPTYPEDDPVVVCEYLGGSGSEYAFPLSRLERY